MRKPNSPDCSPDLALQLAIHIVYDLSLDGTNRKLSLSEQLSLFGLNSNNVKLPIYKDNYTIPSILFIIGFIIGDGTLHLRLRNSDKGSIWLIPTLLLPQLKNKYNAHFFSMLEKFFKSCNIKTYIINKTKETEILKIITADIYNSQFSTSPLQQNKLAPSPHQNSFSPFLDRRVPYSPKHKGARGEGAASNSTSNSNSNPNSNSSRRSVFKKVTPHHQPLPYTFMGGEGAVRPPYGSRTPINGCVFGGEVKKNKNVTPEMTILTVDSAKAIFVQFIPLIKPYSHYLY